MSVLLDLVSKLATKDVTENLVARKTVNSYLKLLQPEDFRSQLPELTEDWQIRKMLGCGVPAHLWNELVDYAREKGVL